MEIPLQEAVYPVRLVVHTRCELERLRLNTLRVLGWMGPKADVDNMEKLNVLTLPGLELRPLSCPARTQSLYRLSYPVPTGWRVSVRSQNNAVLKVIVSWR
jgi:hypothetical protein